MTDKRCVNYQDGFCLKGLEGTKCELEGCVAHIAMTDKQIIKRRLEQEMGEITYGIGEPIDVYEFCEKMLSFINALPASEEDPVSEDLEEEIAMWMKEHFDRDMSRYSGCYLTNNSLLEYARHFANWQLNKCRKEYERKRD